jgi:hypothetical protein
LASIEDGYNFKQIVHSNIIYQSWDYLSPGQTGSPVCPTARWRLIFCRSKGKVLASGETGFVCPLFINKGH